jgi:hypothetical protein
MGSLDLDTRIETEDGRARALLSEDWRIWGPNGGYVAAIALRAAGRASAFSRPASFAFHFLGVAARFHRAPPYSEWLPVQASADVATEGLIGFHDRVWDEAGRLVASGGGQLPCRPKPAANP